MYRLPPEILVEIVSHLEVQGEHDCTRGCPYISQLKHLAATSRTLAQIATPVLYRHDATHAGRATFHGARLGSVYMIARSLSFGADLDRKALFRLPGYKKTAVGSALHVAVNEGHLAVVKYLVENGAQLDLGGMDVCACEHGDHPYWPAPPWTPLHLALCRNRIDIAEYLVSKGAHFILSREHRLGSDSDGMQFMRGNVLAHRASPGVHILQEVARRRSLRMLQFLLTHPSGGDLVFDEYPLGSTTPLHYIARVTDDEVDLEIMRTLLDRGARLSPEGYQDLRHGGGPLPFDRPFIDWVDGYEKAKRGKGKYVCGRHPFQQLLAFLEYLSEDGRTYLNPMRVRVLELWMDRGPSRMDCGWSLLYQAFGVVAEAEEPGPEVIRRWVLRSIRNPKMEPIGPMTVADVMEFIPSLGFSEEALWPLEELLTEAARAGLARECAWLLKHGAEVDARDRDGSTALHLAATGGFVDVVEVLMDGNADVGARDTMGETARERAERYRREDVVEVLRGYRRERVERRAVISCCWG
ncbi:uncharacterized protein DNG_02244 [Cephalotrichum gorgonifer]|uniref:Uncharacterized protein n=1 Tax=Cephalotrichum gorgonifer TaxID=2041049 RepID=A0AAE8MS26_9PEZI|nr:uncharacterized protein DNG_02244 [Cephalotrichum gorgonifer]